MKKIIFVALLFFLISCGDGNVKTYLNLFNEEQNVELSLVNDFPIDSLGAPDALLTIGNYLIFSEPQMPYLLACYNLETKNFRRILSKGQGVNEAINIQTMGKAQDDMHFYAHDVMLQSTFIISLTDALFKIEKDTLMPNGENCSLAYDDNSAFFLRVNCAKRFTMRKNNEFVDFGDNIQIKGVSPEVTSHILQGPCVISPLKKRLAWFSIYGDVMEIYDYSNCENIGLVISRKICLPVFDKTNGMDNPALDQKTKLSASSVTSDERFIYMLYNENLLEKVLDLKNDIFYSNKILIFDWEGKPYKAINVDQRIKSISYSEERNALICLGINKELDATLYDLPLGDIID